MTFLQSPVPFRRRVSGGPAGDPPDDAIGSEAGVSEPDSSPAEPPEPATQDAPDAQQSRAAAAAPTPLRLFGFAALSGAVAASVVALVVSVFPLRSNDDPRTSQLIHDLGDVTTQVQTLTDKSRTLETEGVAASLTVGALDKRTTATNGELDAIRSTLGVLAAEQQRSKDAQAGVNAPALFGVAAVQLRDRIEAGLPFDWELVNLRGIVGADATLLAELNQLAPMAGGGVVTQPRLLEAMQALVNREGDSASLMQVGIGVVSRVLGPNVVTPPGNDPQILARASARLNAGDLPNFVREMQGLSAPTANAARPLVVAAQRRMVALGAAQALLREARSGLQTQLRSGPTTIIVSPRP
jgi:hypothetical protein